MTVTHICYSDESNWNSGQFRSVCMVSLSINNIEELETRIQKSLADSKIAEFKWKRLDSARYRFAAEKLIDLSFEFVSRKIFRIDAVVWDIYDSRHKIERRDEVANLGRMYFHLFNHVLKRRWPDDATWLLCPDEHNSMNWSTLHEVLDYKSVIQREHDLFSVSRSTSYVQMLKKVYHIDQIVPCKSHEKFLVQLSDLFAGMVCFSKEHFATYQKWVKQNDSQPSLPLFVKDTPIKLSHTQRERFPVLYRFRDGCGKRKLGVSLDSSGALTTPDPKNPFNFWWYKPQNEKDKAPVKTS